MKKYIQPEIIVETILGVTPLLDIAASPHDDGIGSGSGHGMPSRKDWKPVF